MVERSPEKAGVGGSTPSLATILIIGLRISSALSSLRPIASNSLHPQRAQLLDNARLRLRDKLRVDVHRR